MNLLLVLMQQLRVCRTFTPMSLLRKPSAERTLYFDDCAQTAAAVLDVLDIVLHPTQQQAQGFCLVRPPGHHVKASRPMGFGLINFMAVAARYALQQPAINKVQPLRQMQLYVQAVCFLQRQCSLLRANCSQR